MRVVVRYLLVIYFVCVSAAANASGNDSSQPMIRSMTLPRVTGYNARFTIDELLANLNKAGLHYVRDSISYGNYYFDTSSLSWSDKQNVRSRKEYYYRVFDVTYKGDTLKELLFQLIAGSGNCHVEAFYPRSFMYGLPSALRDKTPEPAGSKAEAKEWWKQYRRQDRRYTRMLRRYFVKRFIKGKQV
jgi:hypothetical protein